MTKSLKRFSTSPGLDSMSSFGGSNTHIPSSIHCSLAATSYCCCCCLPGENFHPHDFAYRRGHSCHRPTASPGLTAEGKLPEHTKLSGQGRTDAKDKDRSLCGRMSFYLLFCRYFAKTIKREQFCKFQSAVR